MSHADTQSPLQAAVTGSRLPPLRGSECHQSGQRAAFQSFCPLPPESLAYFQNDFFPPDLSHFPFRIPLIYHPRSFFPEASLDPFHLKRTPLPSYGGCRDFPHGAAVGVCQGGRDEGSQPGWLQLQRSVFSQCRAGSPRSRFWQVRFLQRPLSLTRRRLFVSSRGLLSVNTPPGVSSSS